MACTIERWHRLLHFVLLMLLLSRQLQTSKPNRVVHLMPAMSPAESPPRALAAALKTRWQRRAKSSYAWQ